MRLKTLLPLAKANVIADEALRLGRAEAPGGTRGNPLEPTPARACTP